MKKRSIMSKMTKRVNNWQKPVYLIGMAVLIAVYNVSAQTGVAGGIGAATAQVKSAYTYVGPLILAIGGVVGLAGGIRVYIKWNNGDQDVQKELIGWAGSCIFLVLVGTILTAFFG